LNENNFAPDGGPFLNVPSLRTLRLARCNLKTIPPRFFVNVNGLVTLHLSENPLKTIDAGTFDPLDNLKHLYLDNCSLIFVSFHAFDKLGSLTTLDLGRNPFVNQFSWSVAVSRLPRLERFDLRRTGLTRLFEGTFANNTALRSLVLAENQLADDHLIGTLGKTVASLHHLDLSHCNLKGYLFETALVDAKELRTLVLTGNRLIAEYLDEALIPLEKLVKLSLKDCGLTTFPTNTVHEFGRLKELDVSMNKLDVTRLYLAKSLEHLDLGYNGIETLSAATFANVAQLKSLVLSGNKITRIEKGLFKIVKRLEVLELNDCGLDRLRDTVFYEDVPYPNLVELRMSGNPIQTFAVGSILPLTMSNLNVLDMSDCGLRHLTYEYFITAPNLEKLYLNNNALRNDENRLNFLELLRNVEYLDLAYNDLTYVPSGTFSFNDRLKSLNMIGNPWQCDCFIARLWMWASASPYARHGYAKSVRANKWQHIYCDNYGPSDNAPVDTAKFVGTVAWTAYVNSTRCPDGESLPRPARFVTRELGGGRQTRTLKGDDEARRKHLLIISVCAIMLVVSVATVTVCKRNRSRTTVFGGGVEMACDYPRKDAEPFIVH